MQNKTHIISSSLNEKTWTNGLNISDTKTELFSEEKNDKYKKEIAE